MFENDRTDLLHEDSGRVRPHLLAHHPSRDGLSEKAFGVDYPRACTVDMADTARPFDNECFGSGGICTGDLLF